ncbi:hypothetical protein [Aggregatilinea lenta]|uniref:hypothetical protein n=1 Tax=Aggregatilinea lenta TaxID=913108 RepID=UPI000E5BE104|nr:hypothetical protein [Aggregatilinea lenta]
MPERSRNDTPTDPAPYRDISAAELIRITRAFTRRVTNQDRQRLARDLRESGHMRSVASDAPIDLRQFFAGEIDLDDDLSQRYVNAVLLSHIRLLQAPGDPPRCRAAATFNSQDDSVSMNVDAFHDAAGDIHMNFTFTLLSTLSQRFSLNGVPPVDARRWLELMRRDSGITFLWTHARWEKPYFIFVVREHFARFYAFSPQGYEASVRLTPDMVTQLCTWLEKVWLSQADEPAQLESSALNMPHAGEHRSAPGNHSSASAGDSQPTLDW